MTVVSPVTGHPTTPAPSTTPDPHDHRVGSQTNRILGTFLATRADADSEDGSGRMNWHAELIAGRHVGSRTGYASAVDAVRALQFLTTGNSASAAVVQQGSRFYGYQLEERDLDSGVTSPLYRSTFEGRNSDSAMIGLRKLTADAALAAIVDGEFVHRFRPATS